MNSVYLLTGGNIGDRLKNLEEACKQIEIHAGSIIKKSRVYETAAWGYTDQPPFLNQVLVINTLLSAEDLLQTILAAEQELGRKRLQKMGPRTIDIDILFYNHDVISSANLTVPHPRITSRRFVLMPLNEIAPDYIHPVVNKSIKELLALCPDELEVNIFL